MFGQLSDSNKKTVGAIVKAGSEVYYCGNGWVVDDEKFDSFEDFIAHCETKLSDIKFGASLRNNPDKFK